MAERPTEEDDEALLLLLANDRLDEKSAQFLESLAEQDHRWSEKQCKWFDDLCERFI